ncbi:MAG: flagellar assembly protein FliW [Lachnospiraceae bacterium]|nr:flagellar assembly protein FliW [Lachnospiraceae bacterium]
MEVSTRLFGKIMIDDNKVIHFINGLVGFPELKDFALIHDGEDGAGKGVQWLQSMQDGNFALPVVNPLQILDDYNPVVEDELLTPLGELAQEDMLVLVTITVPQDVTKMTVNLRGPIVINAKNCLACQVIAENEGMQVKFPVYDILKAKKEGE